MRVEEAVALTSNCLDHQPAPERLPKAGDCLTPPDIFSACHEVAIERNKGQLPYLVPRW